MVFIRGNKKSFLESKISLSLVILCSIFAILPCLDILFKNEFGVKAYFTAKSTISFIISLIFIKIFVFQFKNFVKSYNEEKKKITSYFYFFKNKMFHNIIKTGLILTIFILLTFYYINFLQKSEFTENFSRNNGLIYKQGNYWALNSVTDIMNIFNNYYVKNIIYLLVSSSSLFFVILGTGIIISYTCFKVSEVRMQRKIIKSIEKVYRMSKISNKKEKESKLEFKKFLLEKQAENRIVFIETYLYTLYKVIFSEVKILRDTKKATTPPLERYI